MAGYSGTPLPKKLGLKEDFRVALHGMPPEVFAQLEAALAKCELLRKPSAPLDFAMMFTSRNAELRTLLPLYSRLLAPSGILWISWPKKSSGITSDINENDVREIGLGFGLVDVKVCAVNDVWSGLKFVIPVKDRKKS